MPLTRVVAKLSQAIQSVRIEFKEVITELLSRGVFEDDPICGVATFECDAFSAFEAMQAVHARAGDPTPRESNGSSNGSSQGGVLQIRQREELQGQGYVKDDVELLGALRRLQQAAGQHAIGAIFTCDGLSFVIWIEAVYGAASTRGAQDSAVKKAKSDAKGSTRKKQSPQQEEEGAFRRRIMSFYQAHNPQKVPCHLQTHFVHLWPCWCIYSLGIYRLALATITMAPAARLYNGSIWLYNGSIRLYNGSIRLFNVCTISD
jgi:hypothetical protein